MGSSEQASRRRVVVVGFAVAAVLLVAGALLVRLDASHSTTDAGADERGGPAESGPAPDRGQSHSDGTGREELASGGFSRDEDGAVEAATAYTAASQQWLYLTDGELADSVAEVAAPQSVERLTAEVVEETQVAREELAKSSGRVWWLVHPLAWRVESYSDDEATVAIWTVTVLSATGVALPQSEWMTATMDLEWVEGTWRVNAVRDRPGPTPMTGSRDEPWDPEPFDDGLDGFTRLGGDQP